VEDNDRPGTLSCDDFSAVFSGHLERNPHISCREISKDLFVPKTTISRVLEKISSRFFIAK
jgi:DNA-binding MarR family transcriptional regulator